MKHITKLMLACMVPAMVHSLLISPLSAQLISIKTVPLAVGDQFLLFPAKNLGMGGVFIAVDDPFLDPFINPAKGARLERSYFFSAPAMYHITKDFGAARTLPVAGWFNGNKWFGGTSLAIQEMELGGPAFQQFEEIMPPPELGDNFSDNMYFFSAIGTRINKNRTSVGASLMWSNLNAVEGVELLYPGSSNIDQSGNSLDLRVGLSHTFKTGQTVEALLIHDRYNMTHKVTYKDQLWDDTGRSITSTRLEKNLDQTRTWGLHFGYVTRIPDTEWRVGAILSGNWKTHPKIPNYELMNIPRDPGDSRAYNLGIGFAQIDKDTMFGFEIIYEPAWCNTWANATQPITTRSGKIIPPGSETVENEFNFSNLTVRLGISKEAYPFGFQLGIQYKSIRYLLDQYNFIEEIRSKQREHWSEWTATWGLIFDFQVFKLRYFGRVLLGTGKPGISSSRGIYWAPSQVTDLAVNDVNILLAPSGRLTVDYAIVFTHQISVAIPLP